MNMSLHSCSICPSFLTLLSLCWVTNSKLHWIYGVLVVAIYGELRKETLIGSY